MTRITSCNVIISPTSNKHVPANVTPGIKISQHPLPTGAFVTCSVKNNELKRIPATFSVIS